MLVASILHTWMYERTGGSVLLVTLFHGALNAAELRGSGPPKESGARSC